jgi:hypothetical protein
MPPLTPKQKQLITQLLIKSKRKDEIKGLNVLTKEEANDYIKDLLSNG